MSTLTGTQLSILDYTLTELEAQPPPTPRPSQSAAIAWHQTKADYYLRLMGRFMQSSCDRSVRMHEINRLHTMRQQALEEIERLS